VNNGITYQFQQVTDIFLAGGPVMYPLLLCSVIALAVIIERSLFWWRIRMNRKPHEVAQLINQRDKSAHLPAAAQRDPVVSVLLAGLEGPLEKASLHMQVAAGKQLTSMCRNLGFLNTMVALAPLLGIFGTVLGIIQSFQLLGEATLADPVAASRGLAQALITTAFGLAIAMPCLVAYKIFQTKVLKLQQMLEENSTELEYSLGLATKIPNLSVAPELQQE